MSRAWMVAHTHRLGGKTVAITGSTGGIGTELCRYLASLDASLILLDRNPTKSAALRAALLREYPQIDITCIPIELEEMQSVRNALESLRSRRVDVFIHNAGAYSIPRRTCSTGYDNVFQINFVSPYYIIRELLPSLRAVGGTVVVVGSVAHTYSVTDPEDVDFASRKQASKVYGNAKRYLMYALWELFREEQDVHLAVTHPGITFTNITAHYPKLIFAVIKHPMKVIFMKPAKACLSVLYGIFEPCGYHEWIGPRLFDVWGLPKKRLLHTAEPDECNRIHAVACEIYRKLSQTP